MTQPTIIKPTKESLFTFFVDGEWTWDEYIEELNYWYPMSAAEYERRLALAWTPSMLVGCAP